MQGRYHAAGCDKTCAEGCPVAVVEDWLASPVTEADQEADERKEQRLQALLRGEIPT